MTHSNTARQHTSLTHPGTYNAETEPATVNHGPNGTIHFLVQAP